MSVFFSICVPNYNYEKFIGLTINSVLNQSFQDYELIIVDNCSSDKSWEVICNYTDNRIKRFRNEYNIGIAMNINLATSKASGKYLLVLSSDDLMEPGCLENLYGALSELENSGQSNIALFTDVYMVNSNNDIIGYESFNQINSEITYSKINSFKEKKFDLKCVTKLDSKKVFKDSLLNIKTFAPFLSFVFSKDLFNQIGGYNLVRNIGPDKCFAIKVVSLLPNLFYIDVPLFSYRVHNTLNTVSQQNTLKQVIDDYFYLLEYNEAFLLNNKLGFTHAQWRKNFINLKCYKPSLSMLKKGNLRQAFSLFFFSISVDWKICLFNPFFYFILMLLIFSPIIFLFQISWNRINHYF
jgi:glycosyltransferase involved in cell wall biosynthesis